MLNLKHLYYFHIFSKELSTTEAAKRLSISVPALSNQLKELEGFLGFPLTKRLSGKVVITDSGKMVTHYTERMFSAYDELKSRVISSEANKSPFKVGMSINLGVQFCFDLLTLVVDSQFLISQDAVISFDSASKLQAGFRDGEYDMIMGAFSFESNEIDNWFSQKFSFPVRLYVSPLLVSTLEENGKMASLLDHNLMIEQANKLNISLLLPERGSVLRRETDQFLLNFETRPERTIECNNSSAIVQLLLRDLAIGLVPSPCLLDFSSAKLLNVFGPPGGYWNHEISIVAKKNGARALRSISPLDKIFFPGVEQIEISSSK